MLPGQASAAVWPRSRVGPSGMVTKPAPFAASMRETRKGRTTAIRTQQKIFAARVGAFIAPRTDITAKLAGGALAGIFAVRDQTIPALRSDLDTLAAGLATALNTAHHQGTDLAGVAGGDLFSPPPAGGVDAAANFSVVITDPSKIAASSDGSAGSNGNLTRLLDVQKQAVTAGQSPTDFYAGIVFRVGSDVANASAERDASDLILRQLGDQRSAISGVSMDEEAANLVRYERAYQAAAHVITVVNNMTDVAIQLGRY